MVLAVALLLVGSVVAFLFVGRANGSPTCWRLLSALAVVGVFCLFAGAAGIIRLAGRETRDTFLDALADGASDGIVVTDHKRPRRLRQCGLPHTGRCGRCRRRAAGRARLRRRSEACPRRSSASPRPRAKAARCRKRCGSSALNGGLARWLRYRVRPLARGRRQARWTAWSIADVTRDRERQDNVFAGAAARHRLSRPRAGRLLLGRSGGQGQLPQRDARRLARLRPRGGRLRRTEACRHRGG